MKRNYDPFPWAIAVGLIALVMFSCHPARAQLTATFTPIPLKGTEQVFGKGRQAGLWTVATCPDAPGVFAVPRERILAAVPGLPVIPNQLAKDVFLRRAASDKRFTVRSTFNAIWALAPGGVTTGGLITKTGWATWAGIGLQVLPIIIDATTKGGPDPSSYLEKFLPDSIVLVDGACQTWYIAAALVPNARTIQVKVPEFVRSTPPQTTPNNLAPSGLRYRLSPENCEPDPTTNAVLCHPIGIIDLSSVGPQFERPADPWQIAITQISASGNESLK